MNAYFFAEVQHKRSPSTEFKVILKTLKDFGITPITNIDDPKEWSIHNDVMKKVEENGETLLSKIDIIIIEASNQHPEVSYLIAQAAMYNKPTLCLYQHGISRHTTLNHLSKQPNLEFLRIQPYTENTIARVLMQFLKNTKSLEIQDNIPSIKFTLRISPRIERFLEWQARKNTTTKARYLRKEIEQYIEKDDQYKKHLQKHV